MTEFKEGQKVSVTLQGVVHEVLHDWIDVRHPFNDGFITQSFQSKHATIEVIEEPFEEGAIYQNEAGNQYLYSPKAGEEQPWIYVAGWCGTENFGSRLKYMRGGMTKLIPEGAK